METQAITESFKDCGYKQLCFACGKPIRSKGYLVDTRDDQTVYVGPDCFKAIQASGDRGYQKGPYMGVGEGYVKLYPL